MFQLFLTLFAEHSVAVATRIMSTSRWIPPPPEPVPGDADLESSESLSIASTASTGTLARTGTTRGGPRVCTGADVEADGDGEKKAAAEKVTHSDLMALRRLPSIAVLGPYGVDGDGDGDDAEFGGVGADGRGGDASAKAVRGGDERGGVDAVAERDGADQGPSDRGDKGGKDGRIDDIYDVPHIAEVQLEADVEEEKAETIERVEVGGGDVCSSVVVCICNTMSEIESR